MGSFGEPKYPPVTTDKAKAAPAAHKPATAAHASVRALERPVNLTGTNAPAFGSDVIADTLRALEIPYIALNPGASYRGLHDSIVNFLGNVTPQMLLCLHEESAVALAHGYTKVTGKPMAAAVHSNVGLFHATMAIFNAWCDRQPVIVLGATGPVDAFKRRPWIDWIHTARDQGAIVRNFTKWDDQPPPPRRPRGGVYSRRLDRDHTAARPGIRKSRRRDAGSKPPRAARAAPSRSLHAAGQSDGFRRAYRERGRNSQGSQASGHAHGAGVAERGGMERTHCARRDAQC